ncbi:MULTISPECIES: FecR domain-containing protein [Halomonadaceae]|uniref:FecR domain-containing protein n=2 Tax=Vreelandella TaxID=3137766 RepID=A0A7Z0LVL0_9GAMM|nr:MULTISPECIES: FecR domain-containing protein [Halomonas]NYS79507.1 FecR domain-containing protein [Halomonas glaciei]|tara:strand:+ start:853 stop:1878 length:1026 start_codon:yes stop_codon:yes gene_type:complete
MASAASPDEAAKRRALADAAEWFAEWQAGELSSVQREHWQSWLEASDTHRWAWQQVEGVSQRFTTRLDEAERHTADWVISSARQRRRGRWHLLSGLSSLAIVAVLIGLSWQWTPLTQWVAYWGADYRTATGDITRIELDDGTQVWLSSASALDVDYDRQRRRLQLVAGEVLVTTGKDPERPLYVDTRSARLTPLGTRFSVAEQPSGELLAVFDGAVAIQTLGDAQHASQRQVVNAGQQAYYAADRIGELTPAEGRREAWANGMLLAENMSLKTFAAELSHHHRGRLEVDPAVADLTLLGAFPLDDLERTLNMVETTLPVKVRRVMPWWIKIEASEKSPNQE